MLKSLEKILADAGKILLYLFPVAGDAVYDIKIKRSILPKHDKIAALIFTTLGRYACLFTIGRAVCYFYYGK